MQSKFTLLALLCLCAATPPAWFTGAGLLVLLGLLGFYRLADAPRRPYLQAYLFGLGHMLWFSFSLRHVSWAGYLAIAFCGGLYWLGSLWWCRLLRQYISGSLAFALAIALASFLRANMPEIGYPHGQPAHCLHAWPSLLGPACYGGEVLVNFLLAWLAALCLDLYRSWRLAQSPWRRALGMGLAWLLVALPMMLVDPRPQREAEQEQNLDILLLQPNLQAPFPREQEAYMALVQQQLLGPTQKWAGPEVKDAPDLVVWPESMAPHFLSEAPDKRELRLIWLMDDVLLAPDSRLISGGGISFKGGGQKVAAVLTDAQGRYCGHHEKLCLVPMGERIPFLQYLPDSWVEGIRSAFTAQNQGYWPSMEQGESRQPLQLADGTPFGALTCYDNAFPQPAWDHAQAGARFLVVLSNEAWYQQGGELQQMQAMTVFRALETGLDLLRCTVDGLSLWVDRQGRVRASLPGRGPIRGDKQPAAGFLRLTLSPLQSPASPMRWWHQLCVVLVLASSLLVFWHGCRSWGRLFRHKAG